MDLTFQLQKEIGTEIYSKVNPNSRGLVNFLLMSFLLTYPISSSVVQVKGPLLSQFAVLKYVQLAISVARLGNTSMLSNAFKFY